MYSKDLHWQERIFVFKSCKEASLSSETLQGVYTHTERSSPPWCLALLKLRGFLFLSSLLFLILARAECVRHRNKVAIKLGIISHSSFSLSSFWAFCSEQTWTLIWESPSLAPWGCFKFFFLKSKVVLGFRNFGYEFVGVGGYV